MLASRDQSIGNVRSDLFGGYMLGIVLDCPPEQCSGSDVQRSG
jgi:hypothetical protein